MHPFLGVLAVVLAAVWASDGLQQERIKASGQTNHNLQLIGGRRMLLVQLGKLLVKEVASSTERLHLNKWGPSNVIEN